jgi:hypothetical protein
MNDDILIFFSLSLIGILVAAVIYLKVLKPTFKLASLGIELGIITEELLKRKTYAKKKTTD